MPDIAYVNGTFSSLDNASIPIDERGHQFGDGVYEVVRVYNGIPFLLDWHIERFMNSASAVHIASPHTREEWIHLIRHAVAKSEYLEATIYVQMTRGIAPRSHLFPNVRPSVTMIVRGYTHTPTIQPVKLLLWPDERWANAYIKTINLLPNVIAKQSAHNAGAHEALLVRDGHMLEASSANAWFVLGDTLYTATANRFILPGITRRFVLNIAHEIGLNIREQAVKLRDLAQVDEIFLTGTTTEVLSIDEVLQWPGRLPTTQAGLEPTIPQPTLPTPTECTPCWHSAPKRLVPRIQDEFKRRIENCTIQSPENLI